MRKETHECNPIDDGWFTRWLLRIFPNLLVRHWLGNPNERRQAFESKLDAIEEAITECAGRQIIHGHDERYLTTPRRNALQDDIRELINEYDEIRSTTWPFPYSDNDLARLTAISSDLQTTARRADVHNADFVERQLERYEHLFTDIDDEGNDLNLHQRRAVVRNDEYNQVIAGAGTGKTLVLTHRIAYLIERGVQPHRIAAITLTNNAAEEIENRLTERFGITRVTVETIHSFANGIAGEARTGKVGLIGEHQRRNIIEEVIREKITNGSTDFARHYRQFLSNYHTTAPDLDGYDSRAEYVQARADRSYETLADEEVASQAEKTIADFLFTHSVQYQYESIAEWGETADDSGGYYPDFYLPEYDIYIEHWDIDESGEVAPWSSWSTESYLEHLEWGRRQFAASKSTLVESYDFEHSAGRLERALEHRLLENGVELHAMDPEELTDYVLDEYERERQIVDLFSKFVDNAGTFQTTPKQIFDRLPRGNPRTYHFGACGAILLTEYEVKKARNGQIDFHDMIYDAVEAVEEHPVRFSQRYDHLLVDEFQDVSISQIELLQALTDGDDPLHLFCVGDDWQSIYAFRGAVVEYFVDFEEYFGPAAITDLRETYRCPETVLAASTDLIENNSAQREKDPIACSGRDTTPRVHTLDGYDDWKYAERVGDRAADLVEKYLDDGSAPNDVMILSRYDGGANFVDRVKEELQDRGIPYDGAEDDDTFRPDDDSSGEWGSWDGGVSVFSAHQAKGREASHVIVLHVAEGEDGFSPDVRNDELLNVVRDVDANMGAEERRLFYVAVTRSKETLDLLTRATRESVFLDEISEHVEKTPNVVDPGSVGEYVAVTATVARIWDDPHETQEQVGLLEDRSGRIKFVAWKRVDPPEVEAGRTYEFDPVTVAVHNSQKEIHFTRETTIRERSAD